MKEGVVPTQGAGISKAILENEYHLLGHVAYRLNDEDAKMKYGTFTMEMYDGEPFIEEMLVEDKNTGRITFTVQHYGTEVQEIHIPVKDQILRDREEYERQERLKALEKQKKDDGGMLDAMLGGDGEAKKTVTI